MGSNILLLMPDLFLHNPHCSKSRAALALVRDAGVERPVVGRPPERVREIL